MCKLGGGALPQTPAARTTNSDGTKTRKEITIMRRHTRRTLDLTGASGSAVLLLVLAAALAISPACKRAEAPVAASAPAAQAPPAGEFGIEKNSSKLQVGFVMVGSVTDWGWNYQHNQGRLELEKAMGSKVHTVVAENIPENADAERVMQRMATAGAKLIFSTSYGYKDFCLRVATNNPGTIFMQAQAPLEAPNAATYNGAIWEASYAAGVAAAASLPTITRYGFIGAHPVPPIFWTVNAFALGAQSVNPKVTVDVVYTNSWHDPAAETEALNSLAAQGVKVVYALVDSTIAVIQAAEKSGIYCISHHADLAQFAPKYYITGAIWKWGKLYEDVAQQVIDGTWKPQPVDGGFKAGYVGLATFGPVVTEAAKARVQVTIDRIKSGNLNIFAGPIWDNKGALRVPKGKALSVPEIVSLDWVVKGVRTGSN